MNRFVKFPVEFGRYKLLRELGAGGMGAVYLAEDTLLGNRKTAVKLPLRAMDMDATRRFQREAAATARLKHPNICTIYDIGDVPLGDDTRQPYLAMEFVEGEPLSKRVGPNKLWSADFALPLIITLTQALEHAHQHGVLHRDIKPANIMLTPSGQPILMDFGLAKLQDETTMTNTHATLGTYHYMAFEQARGKTKEIGTWSDVYSLAVVLFQLLSGRLPFAAAPGDEDTPPALLIRIVTESVPRLREVLPSADERLDAVLAEAMAKDRTQRYQTMTTFRTALENCVKPFPAEVTGSVSSRSVPVVIAEPPVVPVIPPVEESLVDSVVKLSTLAERPSAEPSSRRGFLLAAAGGGVSVVAVGLGLREFGVLGGRPVASVPPVVPPSVPPVSNEGGKPSRPEAVIPPKPQAEPVKPLEVKKEPVKEPVTETVNEPAKLKAPPPKRVLRAGDKLDVSLPGGVKMTFAWCPTGSFQMGSNHPEANDFTDEKPVHRVMLSKGFYAGIYPVTQSQWTALMPKNPSGYQGNDLPVERVSWEDATGYCGNLASYTRKAIRLPSEAEWEYLCRAGTTTEYHWGDVPSVDKMNYDGNHTWNGSAKGVFRAKTTPVGEFAANPWGLYDCHGNVWEWCEDWYDAAFYASSPERDTICSNKQSGARVCRGGSWHLYPWYCRAAFRRRGVPGIQSSNLGFRVVFCLD